MDLESYRREEKLTYRALRDRLGWICDESNVRRVALGFEWPSPERLGDIIAIDRVSIPAMIQRYKARRKKRDGAKMKSRSVSARV